MATILCSVTDVSGEIWDVREMRATQYGFTIALGWPQDKPRGRGGVGGVRVVVTPELVVHVAGASRRSGSLGLPLGGNAIKRVRRLLYPQAQASSARPRDVPRARRITLDLDRRERARLRTIQAGLGVHTEDAAVRILIARWPDTPA